MEKILVWDWPVRLGHWLMVAGFALAWLTGDSESFRLVHVGAGATVLAVAAFRLPWGFIGSRYARFVDFVRGPTAVKDYASGLLKLEPETDGRKDVVPILTPRAHPARVRKQAWGPTGAIHPPSGARDGNDARLCGRAAGQVLPLAHWPA